MFAGLLIFGFYNTYHVLYKRSKFRNLFISLFYMLAFVDICAVGCVIATDLVFSLCNYTMVVSAYVHSFTNLSLGLCQTAILADLTFKLTGLMEVEKQAEIME
jgi:hypothetical protein